MLKRLDGGPFCQKHYDFLHQIIGSFEEIGFHREQIRHLYIQKVINSEQLTIKSI